MLDHLSLATHSCFDTFQVRGCHLFGLGLLGHETHEAALVVKGHIDINEASFSLRPPEEAEAPVGENKCPTAALAGDSKCPQQGVVMLARNLELHLVFVECGEPVHHFFQFRFHIRV